MFSSQFFRVAPPLWLCLFLSIIRFVTLSSSINDDAFGIKTKKRIVVERADAVKDYDAVLDNMDDYYISRINIAVSDNNNKKKIAIASMNLRGDKNLYYANTRALQAEYAERHGYDLHILRKIISTNSTRTLHFQKILSTLVLFRLNYDYIMWMDADSIITNLNPTIEDMMQTRYNTNNNTSNNNTSSQETISSPQSSEKHIWLSGDTCIVSSAQMIWKNSATSHQVLQDLWDMYNETGGKSYPNFENGALACLIAGCTPNSTDFEKLNCYKSVDFYRHKSKAPVPQIEAGDISNITSIANWAQHNIQWIPKTTLNSYSRDWKVGHFIFHAAGLNGRKPLYINQKFQQTLIYHNLSRGELLSKYQNLTS